MWRVLHNAIALISPVLPLLNDASGLNAVKPMYDGPFADGGVWKHAFELASNAVKNMTVEEKVRKM